VYVLYEKVHDRLSNYQGHGLTSSYFSSEVEALSYGLRKPNSGTTTIESTTLASPADTEQTLANVRSNFLAVFTNVDIRRSILGILDAFALDEADANTVNGEAVRVFRALLSQAQAMSDETAENDFLATLRYFLSHPEVMRPLTLVNMLGQINAMPGFSNSFDYAVRDLKYTHSLIKYDLYDSVTSRGEPTISKRDADEQLGQLLEFLEPEAYRNRAEDEAQWFTDLDTSEARLQQAIELFNLPLLQHHFQTERGVSTAFVYATLFLRLITYIRKGMIDETFNPTSQAGVMALMDSSSIDSSAINIVPTEFEAERDEAAEPAQETETETGTVAVAGILSIRATKEYDDSKPGFVLAEITFVRDDGKGANLQTWIVRPLAEEPTETARKVAQHIRKLGVDDAAGDENYFTLPTQISDLSMTSGLSRMAEPDYALALEEIQMASRALLVAGQANHMVGFNRAGTDEIRGKLELAATQARAEDEAALQEVESALDRLNAFLENAIATPPRNRPLNDQIRLVKSHVVKAQKALPRMAGGARFAGNSEQQLLNKLRQASGLLVARVRGVALITQYGSSLSAADASLGDIIQVIQARDFLTAQNYFEIDQKIRIILSGLESARDEMIRESRDADIVRTRDIKQLVLRSRTILNGMVRKRTKSADPEKIEDLRLLIGGDRDSINQYTFKPRQFDIASSIGESEFTIERVRDWHHTEVAVKVVRAHINSIEAKTKRNIDLAVQSLRISSATASGLKLQLRGAATLNLHHVQAMAGVIAREITESTYIVGPGRIAFLKDVALSPLLDQRARVDSYLLDSLRRLNAAKSNNTNWIEAVKSIEEARSAIASMPEDGIGVLSGTSRILTAIASTYDKLSLAALELDSVSESANIRIAQRTLRLLSQSSKLISNIEAKALALSDDPNVLRVLILDETTGKDQTYIDYAEQLVALSQATGLTIELVPVDVLRDYYAAGKKTDPAKAQALIERYKPAVVFVKSNTNAFNAKKNAAGYEAFFEMAAKNRVKTIIRMGVGTDNIDNTAANANGITVIKSLGNENSVAELSVLFWLDALKKVVNGFEATGGDEISVGTTADDPLTIQAKEYFSKIVKKWALADRAGEDFDNDTFETRAQDVFAGMSLEDIKKLLEVAVKQNLSAGIFKHGGIGKLVVKKLNQLAKLADVELDIAANSSKLNHAAATAAGVTAAEKEDVFSKSVVFLHVPGEPQFIFTKDDFTSPDLKAVINPSRPATLPTDVLEHLLDRGIYVYEDVDMPGDEERQRLLGKYPKLYFNSAHVAAATKNAGVGVDNRSLSALIEVVRQLTGQGESDVFKKSDLSIVNAVEIKPIANARMADPKDGSEIADEFVSEALAQKVLDSGVRTITAFGAPGAGKNETVGGFREQLNSHLPQDKQFVSLVLGDYFSAINRIADNEERAGDAQYRPFAELVSAEDLRSMSDGKMMRDNTAINIVNAILDSDEYNAAYGIIFDGFPRTPVQLQQIEGKHIAWQNKPLEIDVHAILDVEEDVLAQRQRHRLEINIKTGAFRGGEEHLVSDGAINEQAFLTFFDERMQTFRELTSYVIDSKRSQPDTFAINAYVPNVGAKESIRTVRQRFADAFEAFLDARAARMAKITFDEARLEPIVQLIGGTRSLSEKYLFEANRTSIGSGATWKLKDIRQGTYGVETSLSIVKAHLRAIKVEINTTIEIIVEREAVNRQAAIRLRTELANEPQATYSEASNTLTKLQNRSRSTIKAEVEPVDRIEFNIQSLAKAGLTTKILIQAYDAALAGEIDYLTVVENVEVAQPKLTGLKATINVPQRDGSIIIDVSQLSSDSSMDIIIKAIVKNLKTASRMSGVTTAVIDQAAELEPELISLYTLVDSILTRDYIPRSEAEIELLTLFAAKVEVGKYAILESNQALYIADVDGVSGRREIRVQGQLITRFSQAAALANFAATDQAKQLAVDNVVDSLELSEKLRQALISGSAATNALNEKRKTNFNFGFGIPVAGLFDFKSITKASEREASAKLLLSIMQHSARSDWGKNGHAVFHITDANIANLPTNAIGLRRLWIAARENHDFISSEPLDPNSDEYVAVVLMINGEGGSSNAVNMNMEPAKRRHLLSSFANAITMAVRAFLTIVPEDESGVDEARLAFTQATSGLGDLFGIFNKMLKEPFESEPQALAGLRRGIYSPGQTFKSLLVKIGQYLQAVRTAIATVGMAA
ncbi:MAG: lactate dehydrogenase-like 2-hydroxyacid dehydrogenase/adenylate kinase family enzyme, partial [Candidatus Omnitrophota bacterium]